MDADNQNLSKAESRSAKTGILLVVGGIIIGGVNGALAGVIFAFILSAIYGWNPYFASVKGAIACSTLGVPTGFIGSIAAIFIRKRKVKAAFYVGCGMVLAIILFLAFAETDSEIKSSFSYGALMGSAIGIMISACMFGLERVFTKSKSH
jgi:hypothetical protein